MAARRFIPVLGVLWLALAGCQPPSLTNLVENTSPERSLVMVEGSSLLFSSVVWDAGQPTERVVPGGFLGGYMFSVPPGATVGPHPVALRNSHRRSARDHRFLPPVCLL